MTASRAVAIGTDKTTALEPMSNGLPPPLSPSCWELVGAGAGLVALAVFNSVVVVELAMVAEVTVCLLLGTSEEVVDASGWEDVMDKVEDVADDALVSE